MIFRRQGSGTEFQNRGGLDSVTMHDQLIRYTGLYTAQTRESVDRLPTSPILGPASRPTRQPPRMSAPLHWTSLLLSDERQVSGGAPSSW